MNEPIYISYYTIATPYEEEVKLLIETLQQFDLPYDVFPKESLGNWIANCSMISTVCRKALEKYHYRPIVFFPADVKIKQYPKALYEIPDDVDFATRYAVFHKKLGSQLNTSILFFRPTEHGFFLVREWEKRCQANRKRFDQDVLKEIIDEDKWGGKWLNVPETYCRIFDNPTGDTEDPVIVAYQASRRLKAKVNNGPMVIKHDGNVGGAVTPNAVLHVEGDLP